MQTIRDEGSAPAWKTYTEELILLGYGTPLWDPDLTATSGGANVGDVGILQEGAFVRLFNVSEVAEETGAETSTEPLDIGVSVQDTRREAGSVHSRFVTSGETSFSAGIGGPTYFQSSSKSGGILVAHLDTTCHNVPRGTRLRLQNHMLRHYGAWLERARALVPSISLEDLILVTGRDLTGSTGRLAFTSNSSNLQISFTPTPTSHDNQWGAWSYIGGSSSGEVPLSLVHTASARVDEAENGGPPSPRAVFIRGYRMSERPLDVSDNVSIRSGTSLYSRLAASTEDISPRDPFAAMFDYIFRTNPDAERALIHDQDLVELMRAMKVGSDGISGLLRRLRPDVMLRDGVATLSLENLTVKAAAAASPTSQALQRKRASTQSLTAAGVSFQPQMKDIRELSVFSPTASTPTVAAGEFFLSPSSSKDQIQSKGGRPGMPPHSPSSADVGGKGDKKKNTTLSLLQSFAWPGKPRRESSPSPAPTPATPELPVEDLLAALTPPAVQSPQLARALAQAIATQDSALPFAVLHPIVAALCAPDAPILCQTAGWDVVAAFWRRSSEDASAPRSGLSERITHFNLIESSPSSYAWSREYWEARHGALSALTAPDGAVLGIEPNLVLLLRSWIEGAFVRMVSGEMIPVQESHEREQSVDALSKHLISLMRNNQVASRLDPEVIDTLLRSFESMVTSALTVNPNRMSSPVVLQSPSASAVTNTPPKFLHKRRQSSNHVVLASPGEASMKPPLDCIIDVYVSFLASQDTRLSFQHLESTLPLLCRALAYYNTPIPVPSASIDTPAFPASPYYKRVAEALLVSLPGSHAMFARRIIRQCMFPSVRGKRDVPTAIQISTGAFRVVRIFVRQTLRERLDAPADAQPASWIAEDIGVDAGMYSFQPSQSGRALRDAIKSWLETDCLGYSRDSVLEEAVGIVNDVLNVFDARGLPDMESDEAEAMGGALKEVAQYVKQYRMNGMNRHLLPLSDPKTAPTTFMRTLCTLLSRDTAHTPLQPPLTHILLSISDHLADADAAAIPDIMYKQQALTPTSPEWINNWRLLLMTPGMHAHSRPRTRDVIARLLDNMYAILTEMADYRRELGAVVTEHIQAHAERDRQDTDDAAWRILSEEVVLRSTEIEHGPILYDEEGEVLVDNIHPDVESVLSFLEKASLENTAEDPITLISSESGLTSSPALSSAATSPSLSRGVSDYTQPSLDAVINSISLPAASSGDISSYSLALQATSALVTAFGSLVFTPLSLGEHNLAVAVRIFRILLDTMLHARCPRSRLCALQFLMRMRADRDHRLHFAGDATNTDSHVQRLAGQIQRCEPPPVPAVASPQPVQSAQAAEAESPRYRSRGIKPSKIASSSSNSRSRSRAPPPSFDTALPTPRNPLWRLPDIPSFHLSEDQSFSERLTAYDPAGPGRKVVLPLSDYVDAITTVLRGERDWEILSYVLCHLPSQLANKHLLCGPKCKTAVVQMTDAFCVGILEGTFASDITAWPHRLYASDATALAYSAITVLISYRRHFEPARQHRLVETLYRGLSGPPVSALTCLHALTLAAFELRPSMTKFLADIVDRLTQIMSNPQAPVHIINFLAMVGSLPELYANFTQDQFKKVFAVCLRYLQDFNRQGPAQKSSWALSQHVRLLSYAALYVWFLAINLSDRSTHITDITRGLLEANEGNPEVDEPTEVCFDWLARYTYASADPRPASSALDEIVMKSSAGSTGAPEHVPIEKTWIMGNSTVITIKTLPKRGWVEIIARRASGLTKILARLENLPLVGPGDVDPDMLTLPGTLMMDKDAAHVPRDLLVPGEGTGEDAENTSEKEPPRPHPITGYVWSGSAPSQRRKDVTIDPSFFAIQLSPYPSQQANRGRLVKDRAALARFLRSFDRLPVIDTHKVGVLYVAPGQTHEDEILLNTHGSPAYTRFLEGLGRLMNLRDQKDVYTGELDPNEDGEYAYAWWDDIGQIVYHVATLMPSVTDPDSEQRHLKKKHVGNDFVRIVWNDSGAPYAFDTLTTQIQFINIVIEPHSAGTIGAFSTDGHEHEYFRVSVQRAQGMERFSPIGDFKLVSAQSLPGLVRQLSLHADWFAMVWQTTEYDKKHEEVITNWRSRLQAIRRFANNMNKDLEGDPAEEGVVGRQEVRDFSSAL